MKAIIRLEDAINLRVVELSADFYDENGEVTEDITYAAAVEQLRSLAHVIISATYGYHKDVD